MILGDDRAVRATYAAGAPMDDWGGEVDKADFAGPLELLLRS